MLPNLLGFAVDLTKLGANETQQVTSAGFFSWLYPTYPKTPYSGYYKEVATFICQRLVPALLRRNA